jgi:hypothetical protein
MTDRAASCRCGQLKATTTGEPVRVSVCHCLNCKKRSGSAFAVQARWPKDQVRIEGRSKTFVKAGDTGVPATFHFCGDCGSDVYYTMEGELADLVAIPVGAFDDPFFAQPGYSVFEKRKHDWVNISGERIERFD